MEFKLNEYHRNVPDEELLEDIKRVAMQLGKTSITQNDYKNTGGKFSPDTISRRFDGWINAVQKAGLTPPQIQINKLGISENEVIEDLKKVAKRLEKQTFTSIEYSNYGKYSKNIVFRKFKTWNNALIAAGLEPFDHLLGGGTKNKVSEYACFEEIERIWIDLGRQPTTTDIKNGISRYSLHVYERRFGSWRKALEAFVSYINGEREIINYNDETENTDSFEYVTAVADGKLTHKTKRDINLRMRFMVMQRDNFKCCLCGASPAKDPSVELHIDHIIPWAKGGETTINNLQTLCSKCNLGKSDLY